MVRRVVKVINVTYKTGDGKFTHIREEVVKPGISKYERQRQEKSIR